MNVSLSYYCDGDYSWCFGDSICGRVLLLDNGEVFYWSKWIVNFVVSFLSMIVLLFLYTFCLSIASLLILLPLPLLIFFFPFYFANLTATPLIKLPKYSYTLSLTTPSYTLNHTCTITSPANHSSITSTKFISSYDLLLSNILFNIFIIFV